MPVEEARKKIWLVDSKVEDLSTLCSLHCRRIVFVFTCLVFNLHALSFSQGLIVSSRAESLQHFKKPWAHDHEPVTELVDAVNV